MISKRLAAIACLVLLGTRVPFAWAQPQSPTSSPEPTEDKEAAAQARSHYLEGQTALGRSDWPAAKEHFKAAWALKRHPQIAGPLGLVEARLGLLRDAAEHLAMFLRAPPQATAPEHLAEARAQFERAKRMIGTLHIQLVGLEPAEQANIKVDGVAIIGLDRDEVFVEPGPHTIESLVDGYVPEQKTVDVKAGEVAAVELPVRRRLMFEPMEPSPVDERSRPSAGRNKSFPLILAGAGTAALGTALGVGFTMAANSELSQAKAQSSSLRAQGGNSACYQPVSGNVAACNQLMSTAERADTFSNAAVWSFIGGGAVALATTAYALWPVSDTVRPASARVWALPVVGKREGGVMVEGQF